MSRDDPDPARPAPPGHQLGTWAVLGMAVLLAAALFSARCELGPETARAYASRPLPEEPAPVVLPPPEMDDEYLPCVDCHDSSRPAERTPRELEDEHDERELAHGDLWCLHCHDTDRQAQLHRADGTLVRFDESWQLCTGCHAKKLPDWRAGVHGKRTGHWRGPKQVWNCVACHDPHSPAFAPLAPKPPPRPPTEIRLSRGDAEETSREAP